MSLERRIDKLENALSANACPECGAEPGARYFVGAVDFVEISDPYAPGDAERVEAASLKQCPECGAVPHIAVVKVVRPREE